MKICHFFKQGGKNTFQAVLATDGNTSFAVFIYLELQWYQSEMKKLESESGSGEILFEDSMSGSTPLPIR